MAILYAESAATFKQVLSGHHAVTVLSHVNPDADAIGTALGVYHWLREQGKRVEIANATVDIPRYLDFLPGYSKIKNKMDFEDSLIIACDSGSIDRLGFDVSGRVIVNLDHHATNTHYGTLNIVDPDAVASSEVAWRLLSPLQRISRESAVGFYAALVSDTRSFATSNMHRGVFALAGELVALGVDIASVMQHMLQRRSLASARMLSVAINSLELVLDARMALVTISRDDQRQWGARGSDLDGIIDYIQSLVTVHIAVMLVERDTDIKVSLRSKGADVASVAKYFGGGGHRVAAGFEVQGMELPALKEAIVQTIEEEGGLS